MKSLFLGLMGLSLIICSNNTKAQNVIAANQGSTFLKVLQKNGKFGLSTRGSAGKEVLPIEYDKMEPVGRAYFILAKNGKFGIIDSMGKILIPMDFDRITTPRAGVSLMKKSGKYGYMKINGTEILPAQFDEAEEFYNPSTRKETKVAKVKNGGKFGFVSIEGKILLEPSLEAMGSEFDGLISAKKNGKYGFLNSQNQWVFEPIFKSVTDFKNTRAIVTSDSGTGLISNDGKVLIQPTYESLTGPVEGIYITKKNNLFGYTDSSGYVLSEPKFLEARPFSIGYAAVKFQAGAYKDKFKSDIDEFSKVSKKDIEKEGWGFLIKSGAIFLPPIFTMVNDFKNGISVVTLKTGKVGYIDRYGKFKTTGK